jgi:LAO/AO transport system kinase
MVLDYSAASHDASAFLEKRAKQNVEWMKKLLHEMIDARLQKNPTLATRLPSLQSDLVAGRITPYSAARELMGFL